MDIFFRGCLALWINMYFRGHRTHNRKLQNNEDRKSCYKIFLHHNSNAVYFDACHTLPWDIPLQTFFLLSIESWVHMCVRRIFFVEQLNIGKTEGGGGLIWSKLTLFRHPIILEETVFLFCAKRHIFTKPFFISTLKKLQSTVGKLLALHCYIQAFIWGIWGETSLNQK